MRIARRTLLTSVMGSLAAPAVLRLARADTPPVTLKLHHFFSSVSGPHTRFLMPWARKVEAESGGRIRIDIFPSMQLGGAPAQLFDQVRDGLADIVWAMPGSTPGRFAKIEVFELPFVPSGRALVNSKAIEDYAAANLRDEFQEFRVIAFSCRDRGVLHANHTIQSIADLKGLRLHVPNRLAGEAVRALGAEAISAPLPQVPMAITGHVIDGCLDPWDVVPGLKLHDLLKSHTDFAVSSLSTATFVLAMNKTVYDRLPRDLKAIVDKNSGQVAASMAGAMWDSEAKTVADMVRDRGDPVTVLTADDVARWRKVTEPVVAAWQKEMKTRKVDGGKLIAGAQALLAKYADTPEPTPEPPPERESKMPPRSQAPESKVAAPPQQPPPAAEAKAAAPSPSAPPAKTAAPSPATPQAKADAAMPKSGARPAAPPVQLVPRKQVEIPL